MAIIRPLLPAALAVSLTLFMPNAALAKGWCDNPAAREQLKMQRHQLDEQRHMIERQYRGHRNEAARRNALAQLEQQRDALEAQERALREQRRDCKEAHEHHHRR